MDFTRSIPFFCLCLEAYQVLSQHFSSSTSTNTISLSPFRNIFEAFIFLCAWGAAGISIYPVDRETEGISAYILSLWISGCIAVLVECIICMLPDGIWKLWASGATILTICALGLGTAGMVLFLTSLQLTNAHQEATSLTTLFSSRNSELISDPVQTWCKSKFPSSFIPVPSNETQGQRRSLLDYPSKHPSKSAGRPNH